LSQRPAVTLLLASSLSTSVFAAKESAIVTKLTNPVSVDGKWTTSDEWSDTNRVSMYLVQGPDSVGYLRFKYDAEYLYLLVDFVSDTTMATTQTTGNPAADHLAIGIDQDVNDTNTTRDVLIQLQWMNGKDTPAPASPPWVKGAISYDATNDSDSQTPHAIFELTIPMSAFIKNSAIRVSVWDPSRAVNMHWPAIQDRTRAWSTEYFADLIFSDVVVSKFTFGPATTLASTVLAPLVLTRRKTRPAVWKQSFCAFSTQ